MFLVEIWAVYGCHGEEEKGTLIGTKKIKKEQNKVD